MSEQLNFEQMIEESMKNINIKETIEGTIININKKGEVIIDIGYKADGIIPKNEYSYNEAADPNKELKIGDKITAEVIKMNDGEGNVFLFHVISEICSNPCTAPKSTNAPYVLILVTFPLYFLPTSASFQNLSIFLFFSSSKTAFIDPIILLGLNLHSINLNLTTLSL